MPNYGQYGSDSTWKGRFDYRQANHLRRNFKKSDAWCTVDVISPELVASQNVESHIFNTSIKSIGVKQVACHPDFPFSQGTIIDYVDSKKYICADMDEHQSIQKFGRAYLMNTVLNWVDDKGELRIEYGVDNESLGNQDGARQVVQTDGRKTVWVQNNIHTKKLVKNFRFVFGGVEAYKITFIDNWSKDGLIMFKLETTQILEQDDLVNNIAYNQSTQFTPTPTNNIQFSTNELKVAQNYTSTISVSEVGVPSTTFTFAISGVPLSSYEIVSSTGNSITIKCKEYYYEGVLKATSSADTLKFAEVPLILKGLF